MGYAVAQLVEALRYKLERRGLDSRWCHWNFSLTESFRSLYGPGVDSAYNRNACQEYLLEYKGGRCVGLTLSPSCADCLEILGASTSWNPQGLSRPVMGLLYLYAHVYICSLFPTVRQSMQDSSLLCTAGNANALLVTVEYAG